MFEKGNVDDKYDYRVHKQKSVETYQYARSTLWGSGIALLVRTSNAEAHADMYTPYR